ncbi:MAG: mucoidy inhibitor MuiA family protein [Spirochaetes bacterium]|nr:mucoidy inhibitor MuiA family protein [Spirochaetota bacterium]
MIMKNLSLCLACIVLATGLVFAAKSEEVVVSKIDRVMVYRDRAFVTRVARLSVGAAGVVDAVFPGLPNLLADDSVRAKVTPATVKILDVQVKSVSHEQAADPKAQVLQERLQGLDEEKGRIESRLRVLSIENDYLDGVRKSYLNAFSGLRPKSAGGGDESPARPSVQELDALLKFLVDKHQSNALAVQREQKSLQTLLVRIGVVKHDLAQLESGGGRETKTVRVTVETAGAPVEIELAYQIMSVEWSPGYDIRVLLDEKKTEFTGYGVVSQSSGEDWLQAQIGFSTAVPAVRGWVPDLVPVYAIPQANLPSDRRSTAGGRRLATQQEANRMLLDNVAEKESGGAGGDGSLTETSSSGDGRAGSLVFTVPKRADIPSDGSPHRTMLSLDTFPVRFEYLCVPKLSPHAFLQAVGSNTLTTPILRGNLNIFLGGDFVGSSFTENILPGEPFELTLSVNENIRVTRTLEEREEKTSGLLGDRIRSTFTFNIKVENYTGSEIVMNILDQVPVSGTEDVTVEGFVFSREPVIRNKQGIVKWQLSMKPKETVNITFSFTVSAPKDKGLAFIRTALPPSVYLQQLNEVKGKKDIEQDFNFEKKAAPGMRMKQY